MNTKRRKTGARLGALLLCFCLMMGLLPMTAFADGTGPIKRNTYNVYAENVINGGSDSQVYANTVTVKRDGYDGDEILVLHYVYSPNAIHSNELMEKIRAGLSEPYKSLVPTFEEGDYNRGFLRVSQDQEKYGSMDLDWGNVAATAAALTPNRVSSLSTHNNSDTAISVTDISEIHSGEKVVSEKQLAAEDFYTNPPELGKLGIGKNRVEAMVGVTYRTETVEDKAHYDVFNSMHVTQIYAQGAVSIDKIKPASDPIDLPVRVLEEGDAEYSPAPELSASFTPDTAVTVGEFNQWQGLAIDYYNPMVDAELSEGYDIQAEYTVSIPLENYEGTTLSGTLTIPLPQGYDGASARIKGGVSASRYTATTVTFPLTLDVSGGTAEALELLIEYKEAQESNAPVITSGANSTWQKGGTDGLSFTSNAAFADFIKVQVDGNDLDASNYTVKEGSTIVTLNAAYLETLSVGKHTLEIESKNGIAETEFTITAAQTGGDDPTGGSSSSYREREYGFWMDVRDEIRHADPGDTVKANARTYDRMPWSVMEALRNSDNVTLHIIWNDGEDIIIPSEAALSEQSRVYYPLSYLEDMTFEVESEAPAADLDKINPETGGILTETPELAEKGIEQPLSGVYEPEEATASPAEETGTNGLLIASAVVALAAAGGGFWYWKRRRVR